MSFNALSTEETRIDDHSGAPEHDAIDPLGAAEDSPNDGVLVKPKDRSLSGDTIPSVLAISSLALSFISLSGAWAADFVLQRQELIGRMQGNSASVSDQIESIYATPWHAAATLNGILALLGILTGFSLKLFKNPHPWKKNIAAGGVALGLLALSVAVGIFFDLFTEIPIPAE
ncbi:hypothetical protein [Streptomyces albireticuli]|uniref:hypothetical protein n=1 Tax=Streptomyces albireticuli TaxID=1940 RepID=UPI00118016D5|nr:hypothetical protein [Streptomyces albireticuli]MCD9146151.1 hypothetical protein [Streptomyces albireticuli]MCD9166265.1 hypothetical protein [Streptomyces albireticuli]MCD9196590.1 hypothetical protein [Streptomyces albireticuli]